MEHTPEPHEADVMIGVIRWQGTEPDDGPEADERAEVIRLAPYLLARRGNAVAPSRRA